MGFTGRTLAPLTLLLAITFPTLANWSSEEPQTRKHVVRPNETLKLIAGSYGFEVNELAEYNQLDLTQVLRPGQIIYFPTEISYVPPEPTPYDQVRPLNAETYPNTVGESKPIGTTTAKLGNTSFFSGKEADVSKSGTNSGNPFVSDLDYNFTKKVDKSQKDKNSDSREGADGGTSNNRDGSVKGGGESSSDLRFGYKKKTTKKNSDSKKEDEIGDDESPALAAFGLRPYAYFGNGDDLREVLRNFAGSYYMPIVIAEEVD